jgi:UDP-N-acetylglucosamine/UDP-N-acetylgalactosamine diphosphorylase
MANSSVDYFALAETLNQCGQAHLLADVSTLEVGVRERYLQQLSAINWPELQRPYEAPAMGVIGSSRVVTKTEITASHSELSARGEAAYRAGQVAILMVAGGQGTRLGSDAPKGCFQIAPHSGKSIFQLHAERVLALSRRIGKTVPFLIMTSAATDSETRDFIQAHGYFGLEPTQVHFFSQGAVPSLDEAGRALLQAPGKLLENPDGHGGCFTALVNSGNLQRLVAGGIRHLIYIQVDNILGAVDDVALIGLAERDHTDVITKVLEKAHPDEKVGHLVSVSSAEKKSDHMVEYTEVTHEMARSRNTAGELIYRWGNTAMHCWSVAFLQRLVSSGYQLPLHRSRKPLTAWIDGRAQSVTGWKSERFIFDLLPLAATSIGLEVDRAVEFAPVKNAAVTNGKANSDSPTTAVQLASELYASWLRAAGVTVTLPPNARIEISPLYAATKAEFLAKWDGRLKQITGDFYLEG